MLRDDNTMNGMQRVGYISNRDIPELTDKVRRPGEASGLLRMVGMMAVGMIGAHVGATMLKGAVDDIARASSNVDISGVKSMFATNWLGKKVATAAKDLKDLDAILEQGEGIATLKTGAKISTINLLDRESTPASEMLRRELIARGSRWARMAPYEIPAAYVVNKAVIERDQLKEEIRQGTFHPYNPMDWIGDFAVSSVKFAAMDLTMGAALPMGRYANATLESKSPGYLAWKNSVKAVNADHAKWLATRSRELETVVNAVKTGMGEARQKVKAADLTTRSTGHVINEAVENLSRGQAVKTLQDAIDEHTEKFSIYATTIFDRIKTDLHYGRVLGAGHTTSEFRPTAATMRSVSNMLVGKGSGGELGRETVFGMFSDDVANRLARNTGIDKEVADQVLVYGRQAMKADKVDDLVSRLYRSPEQSSTTLIASDLMSETGLTDFEERMAEIGLGGKVDAKSFSTAVLDLAHELGYNGAHSGRVSDYMARRVGNVIHATETIPDQLLKQVGTTRRVAMSTEDILAGGNMRVARERMVHDVFSSLGYEDEARYIGSQGEDALWRRWTQMTGSDQRQAAHRLRALSVAKGKSVYRESDRFNFFGLRRASIDEMLAINASKRSSSTGHVAKSIAHDPQERRDFIRGLGVLENRLGKGRARDMLGDSGLFISAKGEVVDFRSFYSMAGKAKRWSEEYLQLPVIGINPLQLLSTPNFEADGSRVRLMPQSTNIYAMRNAKGFNQYSPTFGIGRQTYAFSKEGRVQNLGKWIWGSSEQNSIFSRYARYPLTKSDGARERTFLKGGGQDPSTLKGRVFNFLDISQNTEHSIPHRVGRRLTRSRDPRAFIGSPIIGSNRRLEQSWFGRMLKGFGFEPGMDGRPTIPETGQYRYLPEEFKRIASITDDDLYARAETRLADQGHTGAELRSRARREVAADAQAHRGMRDKLYGEVASRLEHNTDSSTIHYMASVLRSVKDSHGNPIMPDFDLNTVEGLQSAMAHMENLVARNKVPRQVNNVLTELAAQVRGEFVHGSDIGQAQFQRTQRKIVQFYTRLVGLTPGEHTLTGVEHLQEVVETAREDMTRGRLSAYSYNQVVGQVEAAKIRVHSSGPLPDNVVGSVQEALRTMYGPDLSVNGGMRYFYKERGGGGLHGLAELWRSTFGNPNWVHQQASSLDAGKPVFDPFKGSQFIAVPSFLDRSGLNSLASHAGDMVTDGIHASDPYSVDKTARAIGGIFAGNKGGMTETSGTIMGWHLVNRVVDQFASVGLGVEGWRYDSPIDYYVKGVLGKRVVPIYAGLQLWQLAKATPGIGVNGLMGAEAYAIGPGLGQARAAVIGATGMNTFFGRMADVMSLDEEARLRKWARTPEEEDEYWENGVTPVRKGRWWLLSNQRWKGGKVDYYKPNWYRSFTSRYQYTKESRGSALEWATFGNELSPLRYLDPYHYERKWKDTRPYPVSGDLFTGPWGFMTPVMNATIGSIIKPKRRLNYERAGLEAVEKTNLSTKHSENTAGDSNAVLLAYASGRNKVEDVTALPGQAIGAGPMASGVSVGLSVLNNRQIVKSSRGRWNSEKMARFADRFATAVTQSGMGGDRTPTSKQIVQDLNDTHRGAQALGSSNPPQYTTGGKYSKNTGRIPIGQALIELPRRYDFTMQYSPDSTQATVPGSLGYRLGEFGYQFQEWAGIYGFATSSIRSALGFGTKDWSPKGPMLQSADRGYGSERSLWDLDLGGMGDFVVPGASDLGGLQISEVGRRFLPHRRHDITEVNNLPNMMPEWMPGADYMQNFHEGDPFLKVKLGEARLPGLGYKRVNKLHPDDLGEYGTFDRFKILADVAPYSNEYKAYQQVISKADLSPELKSQVAEIKRQVAERKKKHVLKQYKWKGKLQVQQASVVAQMKTDPNLFQVEGFDAPVKLAGVNFSKSPEGSQAARDFYEHNIKGRKIRVASTGEVRNDREKTIEAIMYAGHRNINASAMKMVKEGVPGVSASQSESYTANLVKYGNRWAQFGSLWESISHADIPFKNKVLIQRDAAETYQNQMVYGKTWQPWERPIQSFLNPALENFTKNRGPIATPIVAGLGIGMLLRAFVRKDVSNASIRRGLNMAGIVIGAAVGIGRVVTDSMRGQHWVPSRRRREWQVDEYFDTLNYVKWSSLYEQARQKAIDEEGVDPEMVAYELDKTGADYKKQFQKEWDAAPVGGKPSKPPGQKMYAELGPVGALAMEYRRRMRGTMYGADVTSNDPMSTMNSVPKRYRDLMQDLVDTPENRRKNLLDTMPRLMRRILEAKWGYKIEKKPELAAYFKKHELPSEDWEGWLPEVDMEDVKMKVIKHEGLDAAEFGYYETQMQAAAAMPWAYPEIDEPTPGLKGDILHHLANMGVRDAVVQFVNVPGAAGGFDMDLVHDRTNDIRGILNGSVGFA